MTGLGVSSSLRVERSNPSGPWRALGRIRPRGPALDCRVGWRLFAMTGLVGSLVIASGAKQSMGALVGVGADQATGAGSGLPRRLAPLRNDGVGGFPRHCEWSEAIHGGLGGHWGGSGHGGRFWIAASASASSQ